MNEIIINILNALIPIAITGLTGLIGTLAIKGRAKANEQINTEIKKQIVCDTVHYVQQVFETLDGKEKLEKAKEAAKEWLVQKGIEVPEIELKILIESCIHTELKGK